MGFVGNYAPCGLAPQIDGMPVILKKGETAPSRLSCLYDDLRPLLCSASN